MIDYGSARANLRPGEGIAQTLTPPSLNPTTPQLQEDKISGIEVNNEENTHDGVVTLNSKESHDRIINGEKFAATLLDKLNAFNQLVPTQISTIYPSEESISQDVEAHYKLTPMREPVSARVSA